MTRYNYPVPNGLIYGASLKIQNTSSETIPNIFKDCGIFVTYDNGNGIEEFPLVTAADSDLTEIPPLSTIWIHRTEPVPWQALASCKLAVDSTSLPTSCLLTPVIKLGVVENEPKGMVV